jgi:hypothetical protein
MTFLCDYHHYFTKEDSTFLWHSLDVVEKCSHFYITAKVPKHFGSPAPSYPWPAVSLQDSNNGSTKNSNPSYINSYPTSKAPPTYWNGSKPSTLTRPAYLFI